MQGKISLKQSKLERVCKNNGDSYCLYNSFRELLALINRSASRAGQNTLNTTAPSGPSYDGGSSFCHRAHRAAKSRREKKILVKSAYGDKICHRTSQSPSSKLLKTVTTKNDEQNC